MTRSGARVTVGIAVAGTAATLTFGMAGAAQAAPTGGANDACPGHSDRPNLGDPSMNGNGGGNATGRPDAGTVGNADAKNPPGQFEDGDEATTATSATATVVSRRATPRTPGARDRTAELLTELPPTHSSVGGQFCVEGRTRRSSGDASHSAPERHSAQASVVRAYLD